MAHHITKFARIFKLIKRGKYSELYRIINKKFGNRKQKLANKIEQDFQPDVVIFIAKGSF